MRLGLLISLGFLTLYICTAPVTNVSYADSDFMITAGYFGGLAHPPGYPLYMLLMNLFTHLPIPGSIAFRGNLLSAVLHAATLYFVYQSVWLLIKHLQQTSASYLLSKSVDRALISFMSTSFLGFSFLFWTYSLVAEKYALNDLFAAIIMWFALKIISQTTNLSSSWIRLSLVFGLALMHHQTIVLLLPLILYLIITRRNSVKPIMAKVLLSFFTGILASLGLLLLFNSNHALVSWRFPQTWSGLVAELTRQDLTGVTMTGTERSMYLTGVSLDQMIAKIPSMFNLYRGFFGLLPLLLMTYGAYRCFKLNKRLSVPLIILLVSTTVFVPLYVDWPATLAEQAIKIRMHLLGQVAIPLFIALGLYQFTLRLSQISTTSRRFVAYGFLTSLVALFLYRVFVIFPEANLKTFDFTHRYYSAILSQVPHNSLLVCMSDVSCFGLMYSHLVENNRPDIILLPTIENATSSYLDRFPNLHGFNYPTEPAKTLDYISWNLSQRPVAIVDMQQPYYQAMGMDYGILKYLPSGYFGLVDSQLAPVKLTNDYTLSKELAASKFAPFDQSRQQLKAALTQQHLLNARTLRRLSAGTPAVQTEIAMAQQLVQDLPSLYQNYVKTINSQLPTLHGFEPYGNATASSTQSFFDQAKIYQAQGDLDLALIGFRGATLADPRNVEYRNQYLQQPHLTF